MVSSPTVSDSLKANILVVDDQPKNLKLLSHLLEEEGYEVQQAINGKVALKALTQSNPDIILLDIHMPELDGYTVCQKIKTAPETQDIPVIFVTALNESWDKVKGFSVGGSDYITKPFKIIEVLARVENQLKVRHLQLKVRELEKENQELKAGLQKFKY
ncbi:MAG: response regulator [Okeania sp. SIO3I5]|nr:response regulator [Okeania sp. SIO3I5]